MDASNEFENALKAAFEMPQDTNIDPFSVDPQGVGRPSNPAMKTVKRKHKDINADDRPTFSESVAIETVAPKNPNPNPKKVKAPATSSRSSVDTSKQDKIFKMCLAYIDGFPEACIAPAHFAPNLPSDELQFILDGFQRRVQSQNELEMMRTGLITSAAVMENVMNFIPGQPLKLHGLADNFHASISRFDACLKEIAIKYASTCSFTPEQMLLLIGLQICIHTHETNVKMVGKTVE